MLSLLSSRKTWRKVNQRWCHQILLLASASALAPTSFRSEAVSIDRATMAYMLWAVYVVTASWVITRLLYSPPGCAWRPYGHAGFRGHSPGDRITATVLPHPHGELPQGESNGVTGFTDLESVWAVLACTSKQCVSYHLPSPTYSLLFLPGSPIL